MEGTLKDTIKELLLEELRINISNDQLENIEPEEKERLINAGYYNDDITLDSINDILIDYSDSEFTDSSLLELVNSSEFIKMVRSNRQFYLVGPIFNYLISSNDDYISTEAMTLFFTSYKSLFKNILFVNNKYYTSELCYPNKYFANIDKLYKPNTLDSIVIGGKFRPDVIGSYSIDPLSNKFQNRVDYKELKGVYNNFSDIKPIAGLYLNEDVSNSSYTYIFNKLYELYNNIEDINSKNEIKLLIDLINNYGNYKVEGTFDLDSFNRLLSKCDERNLDLDNDNLLNFIQYFENLNPRMGDVVKIVKDRFSSYKRSSYNYDYFEFIKEFNETVDVDFKDLFGGKGTRVLTPEILQSFSGSDNYPYLIDLMGNHKSTEKYISSRRKWLATFLNKERQENLKRTELLNKYQKNLDDLANMEPNTMTLEYYIFNNIPEEDRIDFFRIVNFYLNFNNFTSVEAKQNVYNKALHETISALKVCEFANYDKIIEKHSVLLTKYGTFDDKTHKNNFIRDCNVPKNDIATNYLLRNIDDLRKCMNENNMYVAVFRLNNKSIIDAIEFVKSDNEEIKEICERYLRDQKEFYEELKDVGIINFNILDYMHILNIYLENKEKFYNEVSYKVSEVGKVNNNYYLIVRNFISGDYFSKERYLRDENIPIKTFNKALDFCNENHPELIREYEEKLQKLAKQRFYPVLENAKEIIYSILYGIDLDDGSHRDFDYLDFKLATKMDVKEFINFIKDKKLVKNRDEFLKVIRWLKPKEEVLYFSYNQVRSTKYIYDGVELTDEMKEEIFDYLKDNNIGNDLRAFNVIIKRLLNGEMTINGMGINQEERPVTKL